MTKTITLQSIADEISAGWEAHVSADTLERYAKDLDITVEVIWKAGKYGRARARCISQDDKSRLHDHAVGNVAYVNEDDLADTMQQLRDCGYNQIDMAVLLDVSRYAVSHFKTGRRPMPMRYYWKLEAELEKLKPDNNL